MGRDPPRRVAGKRPTPWAGVARATPGLKRGDVRLVLIHVEIKLRGEAREGVGGRGRVTSRTTRRVVGARVGRGASARGDSVAEGSGAYPSVLALPRRAFGRAGGEARLDDDVRALHEPLRDDLLRAVAHGRWRYPRNLVLPGNNSQQQTSVRSATPRSVSLGGRRGRSSAAADVVRSTVAREVCFGASVARTRRAEDGVSPRVPSRGYIRLFQAAC